MPTEIIVTGCGDCPMYRMVKQYHHICTNFLSPIPERIAMGGLFADCPLKTDSITIKLKQDDRDKTES